MRYALQVWKDGQIIYCQVVADGRARKFEALRSIVFPNGKSWSVELVPLRPYERIEEFTEIPIRDILEQGARGQKAVFWHEGDAGMTDKEPDDDRNAKEEETPPWTT